MDFGFVVINHIVFIIAPSERIYYSDRNIMRSKNTEAAYLNSQKITALAAATFRESTPFPIGIFTR